MKKRGFTLIELLVIIALLASLAILLTPKIFAAFNKVNQKALYLQEREVEKSALLYLEDYCKDPLDDSFVCDLIQSEIGKFSGQIDVDTLINLNYIDSFTIGGEDCSGYVDISENEVKAYLNCGDKYYTNMDKYPYNLNLNIISKTISSITVEASAESENIITKYEFKSNSGSYEDNETNTTYTYKNLNQGENVLYLKVTTDGNYSKEINITESPNIIDLPTFSITPTGWTTSKTVTINYPQRQSEYVYSYSIDNGSSWTELSSGTVANVVVTSNGPIIAKIYDGVSNLYSSYIVSKIYEPLSYESCFTSSANTITAYSTDLACPKDITIPPILNGYNITSIGNNAFNNKGLTSVTIPDTITNIFSFAFANNQLTNIEIPNSVSSIYDRSFMFNQLTSLTIPNSVRSIGDLAFYTNSLTSITIPNSVTNIGKGTFNNNQLTNDQAIVYARNADGSIDNTTIVSYGGATRSGIVIPSGVTTLTATSFYNNQLTSVTFPSGITYIGDCAFDSNLLTSANIPNGVTYIGMQAFYGNRLTILTIPNTVTSIGVNAFQNNQLTSVTIPTSITTISNQLFYNNQLTSIIIPNNITSIGSSAFTQNQLSSVTLSTNLISIGNYAFYNNILPSILIPNSVTSIANQVFQFNYITNGNAKIDNSSSNVTLGTDVFANNTANRNTTVLPTYLR